MRIIFVDTHYWVALTNPHDQWHSKVLSLSRSLQGAHLVTTEEVLTEYLNFVGSGGPYLRRRAHEAVRRMIRNPRTTVVP